MLFRFDDYDRTFDLMNQLHRRLDRVFDAPSAANRPRPMGLGEVDLHETDASLHIVVDLPGVLEQDLEINLEDEVLTLSGKREVDAPEGHKIHLRERRPYSFTRSFALPTRVDPERARATLANGVLELKLGKADAVRPRQITVVAG